MGSCRARAVELRDTLPSGWTHDNTYRRIVSVGVGQLGLLSQRQAARMNALLADGRLPYQFTYDDIVQGPDAVAETRAALAHCH